MVATTRIQNRYDHLLRELVYKTQDMSCALQYGVPRSTAAHLAEPMTAHLAKEAGGRGIAEKDFGTLLTPRWTERRSVLLGRWASLQHDYQVMQAALAAGRKVEMFHDTQDADFQAMLQAIRQGSKYMAELPEADMPGFVNRSAGKSFAGR